MDATISDHRRMDLRRGDDGAAGCPPDRSSGRSPPLDMAIPRQAARPLPSLSLDHVSHHYGAKRALNDVSLSVAPGEIVCLVGPSGCGKSTLLRLAAGLETIQQGTVAIAGQTIAQPGASLPPERRGIGLVFQDYALFPHLNVLDNVRFGLNRLPAVERDERAMAALEQVGMEGFVRSFPHALSGGQQQRVALARAMAPRPAVLLLDEPFSGLDTRLRETVRDETLHVLKRSGAATMIVTHDPEEAMFLADRIALLRDGKLVQVGSPTTLYTKPADAFAASFFGEVNQLSGRVHHSRVDTPVGCLTVPHLDEGTAVDVLIRPEALRLTMAADGDVTGVPNLARVEASRLLGRTSLIHLRVLDRDGVPHHLHARAPGHFLPEDGSHVSVTLEPRQAFVFAKG
ncbi:ABC transporter ATP-binding protein [Niveispirillum sp.]|uniref:ABC transporter ATP-binding protein n=1 Tax=Niveispirillum sp. TaxID=1917217 RepID=UPI0025DC220E|nr:ABC transporter ATP-binding protein [Niveispirillum sp.]